MHKESHLIQDLVFNNAEKRADKIQKLISFYQNAENDFSARAIPIKGEHPAGNRMLRKEREMMGSEGEKRRNPPAI